MKNKIIVFLVLAITVLSSCNKIVNLPQITNSEVNAESNSATIKFEYEGQDFSDPLPKVEFSPNRFLDDETTDMVSANINGDHFEAKLTGLECNTTYHYRFYLPNNVKGFIEYILFSDGSSFKTTEGSDLNENNYGVFSISSTSQVNFASGNLQYKASTNTWRFAKNQYEYMGSNNDNISSVYSGWIDLFGWGTSRWNNGNQFYQPWDAELMFLVGQGNGYGPTDGTNYYYSLTGLYANADWGVYNNISDNGNDTQGWRTLTKEEWEYVLHSRSTTSGIRFAKANVNEVNGLLLLPDDWDVTIFDLTKTNNDRASFDSNVISLSQWENLKNSGVVFLPAAGDRNRDTTVDMGSYGFYWSTSHHETSASKAYALGFSDNSLNENFPAGRHYGLSVRLVRPANN